LTWSGKKLQPSDPSKKIHRLWQRSGIFDGKELPKNLYLNHIRKSVSTMARAETNPALKEIATTMSHNLKTANCHYDIFEQEKSSVEGAKQIRNYFEIYQHRQS